MIVPNGNNNENWQNARIADLDNEHAFQPLERQFAQAWDDDWNENMNELPWDHLDELAHDAEENEEAQELYEPMNLDVDYTVPGGLEDGDPRIEHVPALSRQHGDQICELALDSMHIIFHKKNDRNRTEETIEFPEGFHGRKCRFFDAAGTLCVMVFEADGVNTLIYEFYTGQVLGGGPMPEAIDWDRDILRKVSHIEGEGLQVVVTSEADGIRNIMIGV